MTKICTKCKKEKDIKKFIKDKKTKDGLCYWCKECKKKYDNNYNDKKYILNKKYYQEHKKEIEEYNKQYYLLNKEKIIERIKEYYKINKSYLNKYNYKYQKEKYHNDPIFRLRRNVSHLINYYLKRFNSSKKDSCLKHLPYTIQQLYDHLEKQFDSNMSWSNYGSYWDIDHIIPQSLLPYDSMEHPNFQKCWALSNLRPLEHMENLRKGNKLIS